NSSLMDFNRAGVPLIELVTEPDITSSDQAVEFAKELQNILRYIGVSSADMEKGQMRVEANISWDMGTKVEVKNINSFKAVKGAIEFELKRQKELIELGKRDEIVQETRGWDGTNKKTVSQRSKESAHDYRYFPEPDLPPLDLSKWDLDKLIIDLPELPSDKKERFKKEFSLNEGSVDSLIQDKEEAGFFEEVASEFRNLSKKEDYNLLFNYFSSDLKGIMNDKKSSFSNIKITPESFAHLVFMIEEEELSSRLAKNVLVKMFETGKDPETIKNEEGMEVIGGGEKLQKIINEIIEENPDPVEDYKSGKEEALKFLLGQVMAKTKGQADPQETKEIIKKTLS
ncbi:MAG: Asp-tRNA(Asn)/Glu-tRNA(Gln) amidotransferase subunit GatB, partial [Candidatus Paceibacterota bacterium]